MDDESIRIVMAQVRCDVTSKMWEFVTKPNFAHGRHDGSYDAAQRQLAAVSTTLRAAVLAAVLTFR
jgi:hypothetical protein